MKKSYRISFVGEDSHEHQAVVRANSHKEAVEKAKRTLDTDIVTGVRRCTNPYVKIVAWTSLILLFLFLLIVSI